MTNKKKLIGIGVVLVILGTLFVLDPGMLMSRFLASNMISGITDPTKDQQIIHDWSKTGFNTPRDVVLYGDTLYVADALNHRIKMINATSGDTIDTFGSQGSNLGQFKQPAGLDIDRKNKVLYVADTNNNRIQKFDLDGKKIGEFAKATGLLIPSGIAVDEKNGFIYVADTGNNRVIKFNFDGTVLDKVGGLAGPYDLTLDDSGNIYVTDTAYHRVKKFNSTLVLLDTIGSQGTTDGKFQNPRGITIDSAGFIYVSDIGNNRIQKFTSSGTFISKIGSQGTTAGKFDNPRGIVTDENKNIYVADAGNNRIQKLNQHIITPTKPLNLTAYAGNGQVKLTWTASSTRTGGSAIWDYRFEYREKGAADWNTFSNGVSTATSVNITGLKNEIEYEFRVFAVNVYKEVSPSSERVTATPTGDDKCNNLNFTQETVPQNTKRTSSGNCICINEGTNPPTCNLTCPAGSVAAEPEFRVVYDPGYPKMYDNIKDTVGISSSENSTIILSNGSTIQEGASAAWTPFFKENGQPIYDPEILKDKNQLSLQRSGNTLRVMLYGNRTDSKIEHVRGKIYIKGTPDIAWNSNITDITLDDGGKGVNSVSNDFARVLSTNPQVLQFDLAVNDGSDSFLAKFDLGSNGCVDVPPVVTTFTAPAYSKTRAIPVTIAVVEKTGIDYMITESATQPSSATSAGWTDVKPTTYTVTSDGSKTLYAWARRNIAGREVLVSSVGKLQTVIVDTVAPEAPVITTPVAGSTVTVAAPTFTGTAEANAIIKMAIGQKTYSANATSTGAYSIIMSDSLENGTYTASITATDAAGNVSSAATRTFTISVVVPDTEAPTQPSALTVSNITQTSATLSWTASTDDVAVVKYIIYRDSVEVGTSTNTSFVDTGLIAGTTYSYTVKASDAKPNVSSASSALSVTTAPVVVDNDCDGVNDAWETQYGYSTTDNTVPSDTADTDGDSHSDKNEGLFGTNPKSGAAPFPGSYTPTVSGTTVTISFPSYLGNIYSLQKSSDLSNYTDIATNIVGTGSPLSRTTPKTATSEFYRVLAHALTCSKTPITSLGAVTGIAQVGQTLTAGTIVPSAATVTYRWQRADTSAGTYTDITSATQNTYTLTIADQGKYIRVIVTGTGSYASTLTSTSVGPVAAATDSTAPTAVRVSSSLINGTYRSGTIIPISVEFSAPVTVTGIPTLLLETGTNDVMAIFKQTENDSKTLIFEYLVGDGDTSLDLNYAATDALKLPDATTTIKSATTGLIVNRVLPALTADTSLAGNKAIVIDTTRPAAPERPTVPEQTNITLSSTSAHTYVANSSIMKIKVACTLEETVKIYNGVSFSPLATAKCTTNPMEITLDLLSQADYHNIFATVTDIAGNESDYSPRIVVLKPQTHDSVPSVPDLDALHDLGKSSTDNFTSVTQPLFTLMCTSGATVNLYDGTGTAPIGASPCVASTAQIMPAQPLSAGVHTLTAKQIINGTTSATSNPLSVTIDTTPLTVSLSKASSQIEPATSTTIQFTATFNRAIDPNSFVCSDITVVNGTCNTITAVSSTVYTLTVIATNQGQVKVTIYPGRVQTDAGNLNTESTGANTVTYGTATAAQCSNLRRYTTSNPRSSSLNGEDLCLYGTPSNVSYNSSNLKWTYQCRGNDGSTDSCTVSAILNSAPKSVCEDGTEKDPVDLQFDQCSLTNTSNLFYFYKYLSCLGVVPEKSSCTTAQCGDEAKRQELIRVADILRGIPLDGDYECQENYTDTKKGVASWVCEAAEKGQIAGLISKTNTKFRPLDTMTRAEAYSVLLKSICVHPDTTYLNWQTKVAQTAKELGFTVRSVSTFEPNKLILRQELYALAARIAQYKEENPDTCDTLPEELICE